MHYVPYLEGRFHTASPDSQGVPSGAILQFLTELDRLDVDLHSLYIFRNGFQLLGANRRPYQGDTPRRIYSAAKALTGLAVLFAIQEGLVSLKTRLTQLFPEDLPETVTPRMESITVYHLLTMTTGHDRDTFRPVLNSTNSVRAFLEEPLDFEPGTHFLYNNGVPHILGLIVKKVSGINYLDFLLPRFLEPLGIYCTVEQTQRGELEGSRTMCTAEGFAKLSLFYLQEGNWNGQQLLDARLVRAAVSFQVPTRRCSSISFMHSDQLAGYGFQLWRNAREGARLDGGRSQFGFLFPDKEMAIVCNAIEEDSGLIPAVLWDTLYSAIQPQAVPDHGESARLKSYLSHWSCAPRTAAQPSFLDDYYGCVYVLEKPEDILRKFKKAVTDSEACVRFDPADKPGVSNLMQIYAVATGKSFETIEQEFAGHGYGDFKQAVGESVVELLRPIREETERLLADKSYLESVYRAGAEKAAYVANRTLNKVYKKVGFLPR